MDEEELLEIVSRIETLQQQVDLLTERVSAMEIQLVSLLNRLERGQSGRT